MKNGLLIVFEGIDGSGKATQAHLLREYLSERNVACSLFSFPCYDGLYGRLVARYLNGEFGDVFEVSPHLASLSYAGDRLEHRDLLRERLRAGEIVLVDRYVASNMAHQGAKLPVEQRADFVSWIEELEYTVLTDRDLSRLARDRNIPAAVSRAAQQILERRAKGPVKKQ